MSIHYEKPLSAICLGISAISMGFYLHLMIENFLNFSGIVLFSVFICAFLIIGVHFMNRISTPQQQVKNLKCMWWTVFLFYIFQMAYMLFFASEFARDYVDLRSQSYMDALSMQWEYGSNLKPFATIQQMMQIFAIPSISNQIAIVNIVGNFVAFMPLSFFQLLLIRSSKHPQKFLTQTALLIVFVEVTQFFTLSGTMDIDDFILNFSGIIVSYVVLRYTPLYKNMPALLGK